MLEAIKKFKLPTILEGYRRFAGIGNVQILFCQELQKLLKQTCNLTRSGRQFSLGEQQNDFEEIKRRLQEPTVLYLPDNKGRYHLYLNTSKFAVGRALYQIQNGKTKLIVYVSKSLRPQNLFYHRNRVMWSSDKYIAHLFRKVDFDAIVDHLALTQINKRRAEPAPNRINSYIL